MIKIIVVLIFFMCVQFSCGNVSDAEYVLMPELFYVDNFDQCMLKGKEALFCTFTFLLKPSNNSITTVWNIIKNISANPQNYRHDQLRHGICVPQSCDYDGRTSIKDTIEVCYNKKYSSVGLEGAVANLTCQNNENNFSMDIYDVAFAVVVGFYIFFVIFASIYDRCSVNNSKMHFYEKSMSKISLYLAAFSLPRNWEKLRSINPSSEHRKLRSIQGIRFGNMICVIMSHTVMGALGGPVSNPQYIENSTKHVLNMFLANGWYAVQTFFVISGWLLSYHFLGMMAEVKQFKVSYIFLAIFNRYIRLAPTVALLVGFHATWLVHLSKGPYWDMFVGEEYRNCRKNWWTNILFINNYVDNNNMCLHQTWYIAADMQLFVFSVVVMYFIWRFPTMVKFIFGFLLTVGFLTPGVIAYLKNYDMIVRQYPEVLYNLNLLRLDHWHQLYSSAYSNIFGYTIGMTFGYLFYTYKNTTLKVRKVHEILWWFLTFGMCLFVVLIAVVFYSPSFTVTPLKSAVYWSFGKNLFALGIAIGILGFTQKIGWFARWFLEFKPLQVLGRLTYSTYIIHVAFIRWQMGYKRYPASANDSMIFISVLGDVTCAYLTGTLLCLFVEMPVAALQKRLGFSGTRNRNTVITKSSEKSLETLDMTNDHTNLDVK